MIDRDTVRLECARTLSGHRPQTVRDRLAALIASPLSELPPDLYGKGTAIVALEEEVARLLGKQSAAFMIKGVVAQQAALRTWADRSGRRTVVLHPRSHIDRDERNAYERLHGLKAIRLGGDYAPFTVAELETVAERPGVVTVELPLRSAGYKLPTWYELVGISDWCRTRGVPLHLDGARLWEAQPYYDRPLADIAALGDSIYVSFYKGLGGLGGAILAGPDDVVAEARLWQARHCGPLWTSFPFVISAADGLHRYLPQMPAFHARALSLATALGRIPGVTIVPDAPHCNAFQIYLPTDIAALETAHLELARSSSVWLFGRFASTALPKLTMAEISIGTAAESLGNEEIVSFVVRLMEMAAAVT